MSTHACRRWRWTCAMCGSAAIYTSTIPAWPAGPQRVHALYEKHIVCEIFGIRLSAHRYIYYATPHPIAVRSRPGTAWAHDGGCDVCRERAATHAQEGVFALFTNLMDIAHASACVRARPTTSSIGPGTPGTQEFIIHTHL